MTKALFVVPSQAKQGFIGFAFDQTGFSAPDRGPGYGARPSDVHTHAKKVGRVEKAHQEKEETVVFKN